MNNRIRSQVILFCLTFLFAASAMATDLSKQDLHLYYRNLKTAIAYQEMRVQRHLQEINKVKDPTDEQKAALQNATQMLELKLTLMQTFDDVVHLQNAHVRDLLLGVMQKEVVTGADLVELGHAIRKSRLQQ